MSAVDQPHEKRGDRSAEPDQRVGDEGSPERHLHLHASFLSDNIVGPPPGVFEPAALSADQEPDPDPQPYPPRVPARPLSELIATLDLIAEPEEAPPPKDIPSPVAPEEIPTASARLKPATKGIYGLLVGGGKLPDAFKQGPATLLGKELVDVYRALVARSNIGESSSKNAARVLLIFQGLGMPQIAVAEKTRPSTVFAARTRYVSKMHQEGWTPEVHSEMVLAVSELSDEDCTPERIHEIVMDAEIKVASAPKPSAVPSVARTRGKLARTAELSKSPTDAEPERRLSWQEEALQVAADWSNDERISLRALLNNKRGAAILPARDRIIHLMSQHAAIAPRSGAQAGLLNPLQWDTLNLLVAYAVPQGQSPTSPEHVAIRLASKYERDAIDMGEVIVEALNLLVTAHQEAREAATAAAAAESTPVVIPPQEPQEQTVPLDTEEVLPHDLTLSEQITVKLEGLLSSTVAEDRVTMARHLCGGEVDTTQPSFLAAARPLLEKMQHNYRIAQRASVDGGIPKKSLRASEVQLLKNLLGGGYSSTLRPRNFKDILGEKLVNGVIGETADDLRRIVLSALTKLAAE